MDTGSNRMRLLVVDDDLDMLRNLALMLSLEGYYVMTASSGIDASVFIAEHKFDVVITDLRMPIVDGYEIVRRTKAIRPETSIIVTSRYLDDDTRKWMQSEGVVGLEKPYNVHQISAMLREFTGNHLS
ncbi:MAG: response regulator [Proteobacteria bacterium]|nr:response regulator [Pseudomonadota bacterium]